MGTPLACRFGRHRWVTREEAGESYTVCSACGKVQRGGDGQALAELGNELGWGREARDDLRFRPPREP